MIVRSTRPDSEVTRRILAAVKRADRHAEKRSAENDNDALLRAEVHSLFTKELSELTQNFKFKVICDETINPPTVIDAKQLACYLLFDLSGEQFVIETLYNCFQDFMEGTTKGSLEMDVVDRTRELHMLFEKLRSTELEVTRREVNTPYESVRYDFSLGGYGLNMLINLTADLLRDVTKLIEGPEGVRTLLLTQIEKEMKQMLRNLHNAPVR